jgi:hypothetical protein
VKGEGREESYLVESVRVCLSVSVKKGHLSAPATREDRQQACEGKISAMDARLTLPKVRHPSLHPSLRRSLSSVAETTDSGYVRGDLDIGGLGAGRCRGAVGAPTRMGGSMKIDRGVMALARAKLSVEQIATKLKITPLTVVKTGRRLGIYLQPPRKRDRRRKIK